MGVEEAKYWLSIIKKANEGDTNAILIVRQENKIRMENGEPSLREELKEMAIKLL